MIRLVRTGWLATVIAVACLSPLTSAAGAATAGSCATITQQVVVGQSRDLGALLCVPATAPSSVEATGPGQLAGTTFVAGTTAVGTYTATFRWAQPAAEQAVTITVIPATPKATLGAARCSRAGTCRLAVRVAGAAAGSVTTLITERRSIGGQWATYERTPVFAGRSTVRVSAGRYRARVRVAPDTLHTQALSNFVSWGQAPIRSTHGTWPVAPVNEQHAIRASFLDARSSNYHHGVDIYVNDLAPERGAPSWASHRVYAARGGTASYIDRHSTHGPASCSQNRLAIGQHIYYHVVPTVTAGQGVRRGQQIGWSCRRRWHIHLTDGFGANPRNPLRPGAGILTPYIDDTAPVVERLSPWSPCDGRWGSWSPNWMPATEGIPPCGGELDPERLTGLVDMRFVASDEGARFADVDSRPWLAAPMQPYRASVSVDRLDTSGAVVSRVLRRDIFRADSLAGQPPFTVHWAPGFRRWLPLWLCDRAHRQGACDGAYWHRAFATSSLQRYWDTRSVSNGTYRVSVTAWDVKGNSDTSRLTVRVTNPASRTRAPSATPIEQPDPPGGPMRPHGTFLDAEAERETTADARAWALGAMESPE